MVPVPAFLMPECELLLSIEILLDKVGSPTELPLMLMVPAPAEFIPVNANDPEEMPASE